MRFYRSARTLVRTFLASTCLLLILTCSWTSTAGPEDNNLSHYVLCPNDQIIIRVLDVEEFDGKPARIDLHGNVDAPLLGPDKCLWSDRESP
jgi:protein involved in polysaccharide export with SLBB domain